MSDHVSSGNILIDPDVFTTATVPSWIIEESTKNPVAERLDMLTDAVLKLAEAIKDLQEKVK